MTMFLTMQNNNEFNTENEMKSNESQSVEN